MEETYQTGFGIPVPDEYIITIGERKPTPYIRYPGLIRLGHKTAELFKGKLTCTKHKIVEMPSGENNNRCTIVVWLSVVDKEGKVISSFPGIGDADSNSVTSMIKPHIIRMAETRANARALRLLTDVGMTAIEELDSFDSAVSEPPSRPRPRKEPEAELTGRDKLEAELKGVSKEKGFSSKALINAMSHILDKEITKISLLSDEEISKVLKEIRQEDNKTIETQESTSSESPPPQDKDKQERAAHINSMKESCKEKGISIPDDLKEIISKELKFEFTTAKDLGTDQLSKIAEFLKTYNKP